jgi:hypothetical protein
MLFKIIVKKRCFNKRLEKLFFQLVGNGLRIQQSLADLGECTATVELKHGPPQ